MEDLAQAAQKIAGLLQSFVSHGGLRLRFRVVLRSAKGKAGQPETASLDELPEAAKDLFVEFTGPDTPMLTARNGELLNALEHLAAKILRLEPEEHDRVVFDADHFKADRDQQLRDSAASAVDRVRAGGRPYSFPPMTSRERRIVHLILKASGLVTASSGEGPGRFVVLYPEGIEPGGAPRAAMPRDASRVREAFRHR